MKAHPRESIFPLRRWPDDAAGRQACVDPIFATIARRYDLIARLFSCGLVHSWKRKTVALIRRTNARAILDLATGTGDFPLHLRRAGFDAPIVALDRSSDMLAVAREKCAALSGITWIPADLMDIPLRGASFDVVTMGFGLRYPADIRAILRSAFRLLRSGGVFVSMDFGVPRNRLCRRICYGYLLGFGSLAGKLLHGKADTYWHIVESLNVYPGQAAVRDWLKGAGFIDVEMREVLGGIIVMHRAVRP